MIKADVLYLSPLQFFRSLYHETFVLYTFQEAQNDKTSAVGMLTDHQERLIHFSMLIRPEKWKTFILLSFIPRSHTPKNKIKLQE